MAQFCHMTGEDALNFARSYGCKWVTFGQKFKNCLAWVDEPEYRGEWGWGLEDGADLCLMGWNRMVPIYDRMFHLEIEEDVMELLTLYRL